MNEDALAITPENEAISKELGALNIVFVDLFTLHKQMVENDSVLLTSLYMEKLGRLQLELLEKQTEDSRLKMKIKLVQAAHNRGELPDLTAIEKVLNDRLQHFYKKIEVESEMLELSRKVLSTLLSEDETNKLKDIFRVLSKRLHPDLNPHQSEEERDLFVKVVAAYDQHRLSDLQSILLYLDSLESGEMPIVTSNEKAQQIEFLKRNIATLKEKILLLKQSFPFNMEELIDDEEQMSFKQVTLKSQILAYDEDIVKSNNLLKLMLDE